MNTTNIKPGDKLYFEGERQGYTVQARDTRFIIATKPFNPKRTYLYTILDLQRNMRGPCNLVFGLPKDCNNPAGARFCLRWLRQKKMELSHRRECPINLKEVR